MRADRAGNECPQPAVRLLVDLTASEKLVVRAQQDAALRAPLEMAAARIVRRSGTRQGDPDRVQVLLAHGFAFRLDG